MGRLLLLANPSASSFTGAGFRAVLAALGEHFDVVQEWPDDAKGTSEVAAAAAASSFDVVAAMGGDGMIHHAANGLAGSDTALAVLPAGTTNVFARILDLPSTAVKTAKATAGFTARRLPLARVTTPTSSFHAVFSVGFGYDGDVISRAEKTPWSKLRLGALHYARSALAEMTAYRRVAPNIRVSSEAGAADAVAASIQVQDIYTFFGPLAFRFGEEPLGVMSVSRMRFRTFVPAIARLAAGRRPRRGGFDVWSGVERVEITAEPAVTWQADGEPLGRIGHATVTLVPDALAVLAP